MGLIHATKAPYGQENAKMKKIKFKKSVFANHTQVLVSRKFGQAAPSASYHCWLLIGSLLFSRWFWLRCCYFCQFRNWKQRLIDANVSLCWIFKNCFYFYLISFKQIELMRLQIWTKSLIATFASCFQISKRLNFTQMSITTVCIIWLWPGMAGLD